MNEAFVEDAEDDVDGDECGEDEQGHVGEGVSKGSRGALEIGLQAGGHVEIGLNFGDGRDGVAERGAGSEVEGNGDGGKLSLVVDGEGLGSGFEMRERTEGDGAAFRGTGGSGGCGALAGSRGGSSRGERIYRRRDGVGLIAAPSYAQRLESIGASITRLLLQPVNP